MVLVDILIIAPNYLATLESEREGQVENVDLFMETPLKILVFSIYSPLPLYVLEREPLFCSSTESVSCEQQQNSYWLPVLKYALLLAEGKHVNPTQCRTIA